MPGMSTQRPDILDPCAPQHLRPSLPGGSGRLRLRLRQQDKRARILAEARILISSGGIADFSLRKLADRCEMALQTLYNLFGRRDELIVSAIEDYFAAVVASASATGGDVHFLACIVRQFLEDADRRPDFIRAMVHAYFCDDRVYGAVRGQLLKGLRSNFQRLSKQGLHHVPDPDSLSENILALTAVTCFDWAKGRCSDVEYGHRLDSGIAALTEAGVSGHYRLDLGLPLSS